MNALPFILSFLRAHWKLIGAAFLLLALIIQTFRLSATEGALSAEKAGRRADLATYEKVQAQAIVIQGLIGLVMAFLYTGKNGGKDE